MSADQNSSGSERLKMIDEMLVTNPDDPFLQYASALEYRKIGDTSKAIELLESLQSKNADYLGTYYQLGKLYEDSGESEKALAVYREGRDVAKKQSDQKTLGELSEALMLLEDDDD